MIGLCRRDESMRRIRLLCSILLVLPVTAFAQSAPEYIESLAEFEVRALSGSYAPVNGTTTMESITPQEWLDNDMLSGVITKWSGGAKGIGTKLFVHGGGHNGSANNGMYTFDFSGTSAPAGWETPLVISPWSAVCNTCETYADGGPTATHTGDTIVYAHHNKHIYRFSGPWYASSGGWTKACFKYNVATGQWTQVPDYPPGGFTTITFYDAGTRKIYVKSISRQHGFFYRTDDDSWSGERGLPDVQAGFHMTAAWDPSRSRGILVGEDSAEARLIDIDFEAETVSATALTAGGESSILAISGITVLYDPTADVYWIYGGRTLDYTGADYSNIYRMNADGPPWAVTKHPLSGDPIQVSDIMHGSYGRYVLMNEWRAIGMVHSHETPAYVLRLPGEVAAIKAPEAPDSLAVN